MSVEGGKATGTVLVWLVVASCEWQLHGLPGGVLGR